LAGPGLHRTWWPSSVEPSPVAVHDTSRPLSALTVFTSVGPLGPRTPRVSGTDGCSVRRVEPTKMIAQSRDDVVEVGQVKPVTAGQMDDVVTSELFGVCCGESVTTA